MIVSKRLFQKALPLFSNRQNINVLKMYRWINYNTTVNITNIIDELRIKSHNFIKTHEPSFDTARRYCTVSELDANLFEQICEETLESLSEYFEEVLDNSNNFKTADISYSNGVLTINLGDNYGTYVINRQTPNKQIWLSSPTSGPKRYDYIDGSWIYKHDGKSLHQLLQNEISQFLKNVDFSKCTHGKTKKC